MITSESKFSGRRAPGGPSLLHYSAGVRKIIVGNLCSELMSTRRAGARAAGPTTQSQVWPAPRRYEESAPSLYLHPTTDNWYPLRIRELELQLDTYFTG